MLHTASYSLADRLASIELVAEHWPALAGAGA
jgi:hypothetical protein